MNLKGKAEMEKYGKYNPDYAKLYPDVEISDEAMKVLQRSDRKMRYMEADLKADRFEYNSERLIARFRSCREDSYDRLLDEEKREFPTFAPTPEEEIVHKDELRRLHIALEQLDPEELQLITALFFEGMTERDYSKETGIPQRTVHDRKVRIQKKLKHFLEN